MNLFGLGSSGKVDPQIVEDGSLLRILGFNKYAGKRPGKIALLCYLPHSVAAELRGEPTNRFSNEGIGRSWAKVLNQLGYEVDIISWDDKEFRPTREYDLVIFHGGKNFKYIYPKMAGGPPIIHFLTGTYWKFNNTQEDKRIQDFAKRHRIKINRDRYIFDSEDPVNIAARGIIVLGSPSIRETYPKKYRSVLTINNASYPDDHFDKSYKNKDWDKSRHNFLFFAGSGNIHKGLDLAIEAFSSLEDEHLYIVTVPDKKVLSVFRDELKRPNIHLVGEVGMRDEKFYEVMDRCAFVILPSCSEGQAGSVVEAMNQGLIPIISKETFLDAQPYGLVLDNNSVACIQKTVSKMAAIDNETIKKMAKNVREIALKDHNPKKFIKNLKNAIQAIIKNP